MINSAFDIILPTELNIGTRVRIIKDTDGNRIFDGTVGIITAIAPPQYHWYDFCIEFDSLIGGWNRRWFSAKDIEPIL